MSWDLVVKLVYCMSNFFFYCYFMWKCVLEFHTYIILNTDSILLYFIYCIIDLGKHFGLFLPASYWDVYFETEPLLMFYLNSNCYLSPLAHLLCWHMRHDRKKQWMFKLMFLNVFSCVAAADLMSWINSRHLSFRTILTLWKSQKSSGTRPGNYGNVHYEPAFYWLALTISIYNIFS